MSSPRECSPDDLERALAAVGRLVGAVAPDQWPLPTPCTEWPVRRVVTHLVGMNLVFVAILSGTRPPTPFDIPDARLPSEYEASSESLVGRFRVPGVLEHSFTGPLGSATGSERLQIRLYDLLAHGWDLARATGQEAGLPEDLAASALAFATRQLDGADRGDRFAPARPSPEPASAVDRLAAFLGRDLSWTPPA